MPRDRLITTRKPTEKPEAPKKEGVTPAEAERSAVRELVKAARARGEDLTGPHGLLKTITKTVLESALEEEMREHVGYDKHAVEGRNGGNSRNGTRTKTVLTDNAGPVQVEMPRDRDGTFEPVIVKKRQRRLSDVDAVVLSLYARGLTTGEISAHFAEVYGASVSKDTVSRITDKVLEDMYLQGAGHWTFRQDGPEVAITYDWRVTVTKPLLRRLSWGLKPGLAANHRWAMARGEESLGLEIRRRRATSDAERARVPPPPPATFQTLHRLTKRRHRARHTGSRGHR